MTSRLVHVGRGRRASVQMIVTQWLAGKGRFATVHEHVTLSTPSHQTDTQRLRLLSTKEMGRDPYSR